MDVTFIGTDRCQVVYRDEYLEIVEYHFFTRENMFFLINPSEPDKNLVIIDEKNFSYKLYNKYRKRYKVAEISNIFLKDSVLHIEGTIPYIYFVRGWLGYLVKIEIYDSEIVKSILALKLPSSLPYS
jgi:hypothetical protein